MNGSQTLDALSRFHLTHAERANYEDVIHKVKKSWTLHKCICFHKTFQHMVYMFLDGDKMKKERKQKSSEWLNPKGINLAVRMEWLTEPLIGHEVLVPDNLGTNRGPRNHFWQDSQNLPGKCSWLLLPEAEGKQKVLWNVCTGGSETAWK